MSDTMGFISFDDKLRQNIVDLDLYSLINLIFSIEESLKEEIASLIYNIDRSELESSMNGVEEFVNKYEQYKKAYTIKWKIQSLIRIIESSIQREEETLDLDEKEE